MYVIVVGGGEVGFYLARALIREGHEILVIERDADSIARIEDELGSICIQGDGTDIAVLREAGAERTDLFVAVTSRDEDNLVACQLAKHKFNVPRTIARVSNPQNEFLFKRVGIDVAVSSVKLILENIAESIPTHALTHLLTLDNRLQIVEAKILPSSPAAGKRLRETSLPTGSIVPLIIRPDAEKGLELILPEGDTTIQVDDRLIVVVSTEMEDTLAETFTG